MMRRDGVPSIGSDDRAELRAVNRAANLSPCEVCGAEWEKYGPSHYSLDHAADCPEGRKP